MSVWRGGSCGGKGKVSGLHALYYAFAVGRKEATRPTKVSPGSTGSLLPPPGRISAATARPRGHNRKHTCYGSVEEVRARWSEVKSHLRLSLARLSRLPLTLDNANLLRGKRVWSRILSGCCWLRPLSALVQSDVSVSCSVVFFFFFFFLTVHLLLPTPPPHLQVSSSAEKHRLPRRRAVLYQSIGCSQAAGGKDISPHPHRNTTHAFKNLPGLSLSRVVASVTRPALRAALPPRL